MPYDNQRLPPLFQLRDKIPSIERLSIDSVRFLDPPRDPHFRDDARERGWDSRAGIVGSRFNDKNIKTKKQFFENYRIPNAPAGTMKARRDAYERSRILKQLGAGGWNDRSGVTVSRLNNSMYPMMREYFDRPLQLNSDGSRSSKPGKMMNQFSKGDRTRLLRAKTVGMNQKRLPNMSASQPLLQAPPRAANKVPLTPQAGEQPRPGAFEELMDEQDARKEQEALKEETPEETAQEE